MLHLRTLPRKKLLPRFCPATKIKVLRLSSASVLYNMFLHFGHFSASCWKDSQKQYHWNWLRWWKWLWSPQSLTKLTRANLHYVQKTRIKAAKNIHAYPIFGLFSSQVILHRESERLYHICTSSQEFTMKLPNWNKIMREIVKGGLISKHKVKCDIESIDRRWQP